MNKATSQNKTTEQPGKSIQDTSDYWKDHPKGAIVLTTGIALVGFYFFCWAIYDSRKEILWFFKREYVLVIWFLGTIGFSSLLVRGEEEQNICTYELWMTSAAELLLTYSFNLVCQSFLALGLLWLLFSSDPLRIFEIPFAELTLGMLLFGLLKFVGIALFVFLLYFSIGICLECTREYRQWMQNKGIRWKKPIVMFLCSLSNAALADIVIFRSAKLVLARLGL
jgi:hypothetical protein